MATVDHVRHRIDALRRDGALQAQPTFFEVTTAVALELFRSASVEIAVMEPVVNALADRSNHCVRRANRFRRL